MITKREIFMTLLIEHWEKLLDVENLQKCDIFEHIKDVLKKHDEDIYREWERNNFDVNHSFSVSFNPHHVTTFTFLSWAALREHPNLVEFLLSEGANPNVESGISIPLYSAVDHGHLKMVIALIKAGADVNVRMDFGRTPLQEASLHGYTEIVKVLTNAGASIDVEDKIGKTALHWAAQKGHTDTVRVLIDAGADINKENYYKNALYYASTNQNMPAILEPIVHHIAKLEVAGLNISQTNLNSKSKLITRNDPGYNRIVATTYEASLRKCKKEVEKLAKEDKSLYEFLKESDINKLVSIWEADENISSKFDDEKDTNIKEEFPEYAHILIHKANEVKKEIFLYNHKPLVDILLTKCGHDIKNMAFNYIKAFFELNKNEIVVDFLKIEKLLIEFVDFKDVKKRHAPKLELQAFVKAISLSNFN